MARTCGRRMSTAATFFALLLAVSSIQLGCGMGRNEESADEAAAPEEMKTLNGRKLGGPGSAPPSCRSKCGWCTPCTPVKVPIHNGMRVTMEYYPEAWRCQCRGKLYMP